MNKEKQKNRIRKFRENRIKAKEKYKNLVVIKPSKKVLEAVNLPKVLNFNPRSIKFRLPKSKI